MDWSNYSNPVKLPVLIGENAEVEFPYVLQGNHLAVFYANLDETIDLYEIRISYPAHSNIIANCFGRSLPPYTSQEGTQYITNNLFEFINSSYYVIGGICNTFFLMRKLYYT